MSAYPFEPDWTIAPGATLKEWRENNNLPIRAAAKACGGMDPDYYERLERGEQPINQPNARLLERGTGIPRSLWHNLERHYRAALEAGKKDLIDEPECSCTCHRPGMKVAHVVACCDGSVEEGSDG